MIAISPTATQDILLYQSPDGQIRLDVQLDHDTVWLTQAQMAELFDVSRPNVTMYSRNIFKENELQENAVSKDSLLTAAAGKTYRTKFYNLDVIISVGYRVKSPRSTSFRQWATKVLREYLVPGYVLNEKRLRESARQLADLKLLVQLQAEVATSQELLTTDHSDALLRDYARTLDVLDQYDHQRLRVARKTVAPTTDTGFELTYEDALRAVDALRIQFDGSKLFGREKDKSFESSVRTIY